MKSATLLLIIGLPFSILFSQTEYAGYKSNGIVDWSELTIKLSNTAGKSNQNQVTCNELLSYVKSNGYVKSTIYSYKLNSKWLNKVTAYSLDNQIFVVAEIKKDEYSYSTSEYIFCSIPNTNWSSFEYKSSGDLETYGERFHKYIIDNVCNCK